MMTTRSCDGLPRFNNTGAAGVHDFGAVLADKPSDHASDINRSSGTFSTAT